MSKKTKKKKKLRVIKKTTTMMCSGCRYRYEVPSSERYGAARVRCASCGGPLNLPWQA